MQELIYLRGSTLGFGEKGMMLKEKQYIDRYPYRLVNCTLYSVAIQLMFPRTAFPTIRSYLGFLDLKGFSGSIAILYYQV